MNLKVFHQPLQNGSPTQVRWFGRFIVFSSLFIVSVSASALARDINWQSLNLTPQQDTQIHQLENNWEKTHNEVSSQIDKDMTELKTLLPTGETQRIRQLQSRIMTNKMYLMNESMDTFLKKRDMLTPAQRTQLQKLLPSQQQPAARQ